MTISTATPTSSALTDALLSLEDVSKTYGDLHIPDSVSPEIPRGRWVSTAGPSDLGRTTLMNIVGVTGTAAKGIVMLNGYDVSDLIAGKLTEVHCRIIGLASQQFHLIGHLTTPENVMVAQCYHSVPDEKEALKASGRVGPADRVTCLPRQLSGSEQQRVCAACTLINYLKLLLADEPIGNLDKTNGEIVLDLFNQLHQDGTTLIVVTHDVPVAEQGQREVRLDHGKVVKETRHDHDFEQRASGLVLPDCDGDVCSGKSKIRWPRPPLLKADPAGLPRPRMWSPAPSARPS